VPTRVSCHFRGAIAEACDSSPSKQHFKFFPKRKNGKENKNFKPGKSKWQRPCLAKNKKKFKISYHIKSCGT